MSHDDDRPMVVPEGERPEFDPPRQPFDNGASLVAMAQQDAEQRELIARLRAENDRLRERMLFAIGELKGTTAEGGDAEAILRQAAERNT